MRGAICHAPTGSDGVLGVIDGAPSVSDGARRAIDGARNAIYRAQCETDGLLKAIDGALSVMSGARCVMCGARSAIDGIPSVMCGAQCETDGFPSAIDGARRLAVGARRAIDGATTAIRRGAVRHTARRVGPGPPRTSRAAKCEPAANRRQEEHRHHGDAQQGRQTGKPLRGPHATAHEHQQRESGEHGGDHQPDSRPPPSTPQCETHGEAIDPVDQGDGKEELDRSKSTSPHRRHFQRVVRQVARECCQERRSTAGCSSTGSGAFQAITF